MSEAFPSGGSIAAYVSPPGILSQPDFASTENRVFLNWTSLSDPFHYHLNIDTKDGIKSQPVDLVETFNYISGIFVDSVAEFKHGDTDYLVVKGTRDARTIVVVWRNKSQSFNLMLDKDFVENVILKGDHFEEILVNGDSLILNAKPLDEMFKQGLFRLGY